MKNLEFVRFKDLRWACLSIFFAMIIPAVAQPSDIAFKHLTIDDGLSQSAVFAILQDRKGFMWFGTKDGLNRYDGYTFKIFQNDPFDSTSLSSSFITVLFEDSRGWLWAGTRDGGLNRMDRQTEKFFRYQHDSHNSNSLGSNQVTALAEDSQGNIWVGTATGGLSKFIIPLGRDSVAGIIRYTHSSHIPGSIRSNSVNAIYFDDQGVGWVGSDAGLEKLPVNGKSGHFFHYPITTKHKDAPPSTRDNSVTAILPREKEGLWLGTPSGLVAFDPASGTYVNYPHHYQIYRYAWGTVIGIAADRSGNLWLATAGELMRFNPTEKSYTYFRHDPLHPNSISYNSISSVFMDRSGILWFGTAGYGINVYDPKAERFKVLRREEDGASRIAGFSVRSILEDSQSNVWVSTDVLYKWNRSADILTSFETAPDRLNDFGNTGAWSMIQDRTGNIWAATPQGLYRYHPGSDRVWQYRYDPQNPSGLKEKSVYAVFEDRSGNIWIASASYFSRLTDQSAGRFTHYRFQFSDRDPETAPPYSVIFQDEGDGLWLGTPDGLLKFNPTTESFTTYRNDPSRPTSISNNAVTAICADPQHPERYLWIGTHGGLNRFDLLKETFHHYTTADGLPNNVVYGILPDALGRLWMSTNRGISRFNPYNGKFHNFDASDGLQSNEFNTGAYFKSRRGELFFGGIYGLNYFHPNQVIDNPYSPNIVITSIRISNREITPLNAPDVLSQVISESSEIHLSYRHNIISLEFSALDYSASAKNQYAYKLEGFNDDWIYLGSVRTATFTNLPAGDYVFRVRGSNNDGVWNNEGAALSIHVSPPPWQTWWAYLFYTLLILGILYAIRNYELKRVRLHNNLKLEQIRAEKFRELDRMKSHFFANLSHEFRTPLTLILGQVDRVMSSTGDVSQRRRLTVALRNARRLLRLINQLLDLSRLEAGSMPLKATQANIVPFLKNLLFSFESIGEEKQIALSFHSHHESLEVSFEPDKMEKVFFNLLSNAFKFTSTGGTVSVTVETVANSFRGAKTKAKEDAANLQFVEVSVSDTGMGISSEQLPHIFNRFYQAEASIGHNSEGTGIGLALVKELVELHGGEISVQSAIGEGSIFTVRLPLAEKSQLVEKSSSPYLQGDVRLMTAIPELLDGEDFQRRADEKATPENVIPNSRAEIQQSEIILIVEDHPDVRAYVAEQLEGMYRVAEAADGKTGIRLAREYIPDLIITDVMMPEMDGYEMCKLLRQDERTCHIPVIMLTARAAMEDKIQGLEAGVDDYLLKPFSARELMVRVQNLIELRRTLRERFRETTVIRPQDVTSVPIEQAFLEKVFAAVNAHLQDENFSVLQLARISGLSVSQLNRKLGALLDQPAGQLIRSVRLQRAAELLQQNAGTVAEIGYRVGFSDQANFSRAFKKQFGVAPGSFRKKARVR